MATHSYSLLPSSSSSSIHGQNHQRLNFSSYIAKRVLPAKVSFHSRRIYHLNVVLMQDVIAGAVATPATPVENETPFKNLRDGFLSSVPSTQEFKEAASFDVSKDESTVSITVVGASGDLAKKKIFPALFALYYEGCLPKHFTIFGYARSKMTDAELRNMVSKTLACRIDKRENCGEKIDQFLKRCFYHSGQYDSQENFAELDKRLKEHEVMGVRVSTLTEWIIPFSSR